MTDVIMSPSVGGKLSLANDPCPFQALLTLSKTLLRIPKPEDSISKVKKLN